MSAPRAAAAGEQPARRRTWMLGAIGLVVLAIVVVMIARLVRASDGGQAFLASYPGDAPLPAHAPVGFPAWLAWQHGLNAVFLLFVLRSGWRLHKAERPSTFWTRKNDGRIRTVGAPVRIGIDLWSHFVGDTLWVLNGVVYVVLLFATGQWVRVVPTSWAVVPNAVSAALQYASLDWPVARGWIDYNALQQLSYFATVFLAAPLAVVTGLRAAPGFAARLRPLDRAFPVRVAKRIHFWTMVVIAAFVVVHVVLVLTTGAIGNLNHMFAVRDDDSPAGLIVFAVVVLLAAGLVAALRPPAVRRAAAKTGTVVHRPPRRPRP